MQSLFMKSARTRLATRSDKLFVPAPTRPRSNFSATMCALQPALKTPGAQHLVTDGRGDVVLLVPPNVTNVFPDSSVTYEPGRLMSAGGPVGLNGNPPLGHVLSYRFLKTGRYLVICMNRSHFLNDWMFGFVNVVGGNN
jgi:hypothetical protein